MNNKYQFYFDFISDIIDDINSYEENGLKVLVNGEITLNEARILQTIYRLKQFEDNTSSQIAEYMRTKRAGISIALRSMEQKQLIYRVPGTKDRRQIYVEPTKKAFKIYQIYQQIHDDILSKAFSAMSEKEQKQLTIITAALRNHVKKTIR